VLDEGYLANGAVARAYRRRGVAAALLREMRRRAMARGISFLTLEVRASNAPAIALYAGQGYVQVGRRKNYYANPREDAILMTWRPAAP
jgi:ribosomal-protein-alanine N-acetyltransferase